MEFSHHVALPRRMKTLFPVVTSPDAVAAANERAVQLPLYLPRVTR